MPSRGEAPWKILVVEDDPVASMAIAGTLQRFDYPVLGPVESGEEAIALAKAEHPGLILMDIGLAGELDGIETAREIRREIDIPVIFLTALGDDETVERAKKAVPAGFLTKPFQTDNLRSVIEIASYKHSLDRKVREMEEWRATIMKSLGDAVFVTAGDGGVTFMNPAAERLTGWLADDAAGRPLVDVIDFPDRIREELFPVLSNELTPGLTRNGRFDILSPSGTGQIVEYQLDELHAEGTPLPGHVLVLRDVTEREITDELTGQPNRTLFMNRLDHTLERARRHDEYDFAVLVIDLDRFRLINESIGQSGGDRVLVKLAARLQATIEDTDLGEFFDSTLARIDVDQFAVLISGTNDSRSAIRVAERIQKSIVRPVGIGQDKIFVAASIGIALADSRYLDAQELLRDAETAMNRAKSQGGAQNEFFEQEMHASAVARWQLERSLRSALANANLQLVYQPIIDLDSHEIVYFEALARWRNKEGTWIPPDRFIPVAEETGLIKTIGEWTLEEAVAQSGLWTSRGAAITPRISVNVAAQQIDAALVDRVASILDQGNLRPEVLQLEVTESSLIHSGDKAVSVFESLKGLGVGLALDDFGTGYSSLSYLHRFPIDAIKIDRSFITAMTGHKRSRIIDTILMLASKLGLSAVAEGIETAEQLAVLKELGCRFGQGFLFARPLTPDQAFTLMNEMDGVLQVKEIKR